MIKKDEAENLKMTKNTERSLQVRCHLEKKGLWGRVEQVVRILPASPSVPFYTPRGGSLPGAQESRSGKPTNNL